MFAGCRAAWSRGNDRVVWIRQEIRDVRAMPRVSIGLGDNAQGRSLLRYFNSRHPRYWVIRRKTVGVALLRLPDDVGQLLTGRSRQVLRTNISHAKAGGYTVSEFKPADYIDEILAINTSADGRQGREMAKAYTNPDEVARYCRSHDLLLGVFQADRLVAYLEPLVSGQVVMINRILGHRDHLQSGVMYLLMKGCMAWSVDRRREDSLVAWLMYDTTLGANPGLRYFKERLGFASYRVRWTIAKDSVAG